MTFVLAVTALVTFTLRRNAHFVLSNCPRGSLSHKSVMQYFIGKLQNLQLGQNYGSVTQRAPQHGATKWIEKRYLQAKGNYLESKRLPFIKALKWFALLIPKTDQNLISPCMILSSRYVKRIKEIIAKEYDVDASPNFKN